MEQTPEKRSTGSRARGETNLDINKQEGERDASRCRQAKGLGKDARVLWTYFNFLCNIRDRSEQREEVRVEDPAKSMSNYNTT